MTTGFTATALWRKASVGLWHASEAVGFWLTKAPKAFKLNPYYKGKMTLEVAIRKTLAEYGAWDAEELADDDKNKTRMFWIAAGDIREDQNTFRR